jgi:hypothetical protein
LLASLVIQYNIDKTFASFSIVEFSTRIQIDLHFLIKNRCHIITDASDIQLNSKRGHTLIIHAISADVHIARLLISLSSDSLFTIRSESLDFCSPPGVFDKSVAYLSHILVTLNFLKLEVQRHDLKVDVIFASQYEGSDLLIIQ